jgi:NitT/TauT family transport system substrate-binding protein
MSIRFFISYLVFSSFLYSSSHFASTPPKNSALKIGLLFTGDSFPISYAGEKGYYKDAGVDVEIIDFLSAMERDQVLVAKGLDGANGDLIGASLMYHAHKATQVIALTLGDQNAVRRVALLSAKQNAKFPDDIIGQKVAVSFNTIIEYLTDRLLAKKGVNPSQIEKISIPNISLRLTLLREKKIEFAMLPEPLASMAMVDGSALVVDDEGDMYSHAVLVFRKQILNEKPNAVRAFMKAVQRAIAEINKDPEKFRPLIAARCRVPDAVKNKFFLYKYAEKKTPSQELYDDVQLWLTQNKKIPQKILLNALITKDYL